MPTPFPKRRLLVTSCLLASKSVAAPLYHMGTNWSQGQGWALIGFSKRRSLPLCSQACFVSSWNNSRTPSLSPSLLPGCGGAWVTLGMAYWQEVWEILRKLPLPETAWHADRALSLQQDTRGTPKAGLQPSSFCPLAFVVLVWEVWKSGGSSQEIIKCDLRNKIQCHSGLRG